MTMNLGEFVATLDTDDESVDPGSVLMLDDVEHRTPCTIGIDTLRFSPDGRRIGCVATQLSLSPPPRFFATSMRRWVVVREKEGSVPARRAALEFSPDSPDVALDEK